MTGRRAQNDRAKKRSGRCVLRIKSPHSTSEPLSVGRIKSVDVGAGLLANPRQAPEVAFSPSVVGGDVCEERLTALRLFFSSLRGIVRKAVSALAASVDFSAAFCRNKKRQKNTVGAQEGGKRRAGVRNKGVCDGAEETDSSVGRGPPQNDRKGRGWQECRTACGQVAGGKNNVREKHAKTGSHSERRRQPGVSPGLHIRKTALGGYLLPTISSNSSTVMGIRRSPMNRHPPLVTSRSSSMRTPPKLRRLSSMS